jgi:hypothetical protein
MFVGQSYAKVDPATILGVWLLDEGSGDIAEDVSENGNDGTIMNAPVWFDGVSGSALDFSGSSSYVDCGNAEILNVKVFSASFWCNITSTQYWNHMISRGSHVAGGTPGSVNWGVMPVDAEETILFEVFNDTGWTGIRTGTTVGEWHHVVVTYDGDRMQVYHDGTLASGASGVGILLDETRSFVIGARSNDGPASHFFSGSIDEVGYFNTILETEDIETIINNGLAAIIGDKPLARRPYPAESVLHADTWVTLSWRPGDFAVSHDIYLGDNLNDVNGATRDSDLFRGNQTDTSFTIGFPGSPYPNGLVPGTTYYWRIDEVNESEPNSPWKGNVWSFSIPPKTAYYPDPINGAEFVDLNVQLGWTAGFGAISHYVVFGEDFDQVSNADTGIANDTTTYTPDTLRLAKTYYWRVDEFDGTETHKGEVWSFTTEGAVSNPNPADEAVDVSITKILTWDAGAVAASHEVFFGMDADAVKNATKSSPEYKGPKGLDEESYDPGKLEFNTKYFWRIDEINDINPDSPWIGKVWNFTTANFIVIDDFESYTDYAPNDIFTTWKDGYEIDENGALIGYDSPDIDVGEHFVETEIIHGGAQSMPYFYNTDMIYSEAWRPLDSFRDWASDDIANLSLWFRGNPPYVGGFVEEPAGTYTITSTGTDIWAGSDEFHFAFKEVDGAVKIIAKVDSLQNTNGFAKAGVMIRDTLEPDARYVGVFITPENGVRFQYRTADGGFTDREFVEGITAPQWVRIERTTGSLVRAYYSEDGNTWNRFSLMQVSMSMPVYAGLAVTSHDDNLTCDAVFSNVSFPDTDVDEKWTDHDIGMQRNTAVPMYVALYNSTGEPALVYHNDPNAVQIDAWTEWIIPLQGFADQGVDLTDVDRIAIGFGDKVNPQQNSGTGTMYFDDIRLYRHENAP